MGELFASGRIVDLILALVAAEAGLALALRGRLKAGRLGHLLAFLAAGAWLLLALRVALVQGWWGWVGLCLASAFVVHLITLGRQLKVERR